MWINNKKSVSHSSFSLILISHSCLLVVANALYENKIKTWEEQIEIAKVEFNLITAHKKVHFYFTHPSMELTSESEREIKFDFVTVTICAVTIYGKAPKTKSDFCLIASLELLKCDFFSQQFFLPPKPISVNQWDTRLFIMASEWAREREKNRKWTQMMRIVVWYKEFYLWGEWSMGINGEFWGFLS